MKKTYFMLAFVFLATSFGCVLMLNQASAWTEPIKSPPAGNVEPPLNISVNKQIKQGSLGLMGADPGSGYSLAIKQSVYGGIKVNNSDQSISTFMGMPKFSFYSNIKKDASIGFNTEIYSSNSTGVRAMNYATTGVGAFIYSGATGAYIFGSELGASVGSNSTGLSIQAKEKGLTSILVNSSNRKRSETSLTYFDNGQPIGLRAANLNSHQQVTSYTELGKTDVGLKAYGKQLAAHFEGNVYVNGGLTVQSGCSGCGDLAEALTMAQRVDAGEIVATNQQLELIKATKRSATVIGVVSTSPSMTLNDAQYVNGQPVALAGIVPVKVNTENSPINPGDWVTASSTAGVGMKAVDPATVVGKALQGLARGEGQVKIFVDLGWFSGSTCEK